jgi:hypothetical protein
MHSSTRNRFNHLTKYVQRNFLKWKEKYPNIVGAHPGKKFKAGRYLNKYSIVFLVNRKIKKPKHEIPKFLFIKFPDGAVKKIQTDVYEVEKFSLRSVRLGDRSQRMDLTSFGSIGAFFERNNQLYACTNMHVTLPDLLNQNKTYFYRPLNQQFQTDVFLFNTTQQIQGFLEVGLFDKIDASMIRVNDNDVQNVLPSVGFPAGFSRINSFFAGMPLTMLGGVSRVQPGNILGFGVSIPTHIPGIRLDNLIIASINSVEGDSGSPVYTTDLKIAGIVIGGTVSTTYILPIEAIQNTLGYTFKF